MDYLFGSWEHVKARLRGKYLFIFLDFDGTLAPIAATPGKAVLSQENRALLKRISEGPASKLAIISGRSLKDIKKKVGLKNVIYSGNHGLEIEGPKIKFRSSILPRYLRIIEEIKSELERRISSLKGVFVEDKGLSISLHYRMADRKQISLIKSIFHEAVIFYLIKDKIRIKAGKMVLDVRPPVEWDKGKIVLWLLARQALAAEEADILPVYIGDDYTDEDAFRALKNKGLTVFVGKPKESYARYYLRDTKEVTDFLRRLWKN